MTNFEDIDYWRLYGRLEDSVTINGRVVPLMSKSDLVENCMLRNEIVVMGLKAIAVPFMIRSYKKKQFVKERLVIKASYNESSIKKRDN